MAQKKYALDHNYAEDREFANEIMSNLMNIWEILRGARAEREMVWLESYRGWTADRLRIDENYHGRANLYWPQLRKEIETMTRRMMKGIFTDDYLRAYTDKFQDEDLTTCNTQVVTHYLDQIMHFPGTAEPWIKQGVIYGTSPLRTFWKREANEQFFKEKVFKEDSLGNLIPSSRAVQKMVTSYDAPVARAEDIFQTWIYPHNIDHSKHAEAVYHRTHVTWEMLLQRQNKQMVMGVNEELVAAILDDAKNPDKSTYFKILNGMRDQGQRSGMIDYDRNLERLLQFADSGQFEAIQNNGWFDLMEIWVKLKLPGQEMAVPCVVEVLNYQHVLRIQRNPFWHQKAPFDWMRYVKPPPGEYYGRGLPEPIIKMQSQLNDTLNQGMDSATLALNPITIINPAYAPNAESFEVEAGAQWYADPNGVKNFEFPDLSEIAIKNSEHIRTIMSQMSDNSPQLPDPIAGKARSTGQAQMAMDEWSTDQFAFMRSIAEEALAPFAQKIHMLIQQHVKDSDIIKIAGKYAGQWISRIVTPDDIMGNYSFHWNTTLQIQQQQVKTQQMLNFIKVYAQIPPQEQAKIRFNWENFLIDVLKDGFSIRDITKVIETPRMTASTPPNIENMIIKQGGEVMVTDSDDDKAHIGSHTQAQNELAGSDKYLRSLFDQHIQLHTQAIQKKQMEAAQQQMMMQQQQQMALAQSQGGGKKQPKQGNPGGNPGQVNESTDTADMNRGLANG